MSVSGSFIKRDCVLQCLHYTLEFASVSSTVSLECIFSPPSLSLPPAKWIYPDRQLDKQTIVGRALNTVQSHKAWCMCPMMTFYFYRWTGQLLCIVERYYYMFVLVKCLDRGRDWTQAIGTVWYMLLNRQRSFLILPVFDGTWKLLDVVLSFCFSVSQFYHCYLFLCILHV